MDFKDYYATLEVPKTATDAEIKRAYRKLARKYHPDLNPGDKTAETRFKELNEANEVLGDPEKRKKYDELGANWRMYEQTPPPRPGGRTHVWTTGNAGAYQVNADDLRDMFGGAGGDQPFSDFFQAFFGGRPQGARTGGRARRAQPARGQDVESAVDLTLEEAFSGTTRRLRVAGDGPDRTIDVRIPAGIHDGARVRAAGEGAGGDGARGDLFLTVHIVPHQRFERRGQDLHVRVPVPVTTAVLGGEVGVPTLSGTTLRLKVPEMTTGGRIFRLRGHGMPAVGKPDERGDLYATVDLQIPAAMTPEHRRHYEALKALDEGRTS
jgi:DnaJ-class molecular chaperone